MRWIAAFHRITNVDKPPPIYHSMILQTGAWSDVTVHVVSKEVESEWESHLAVGCFTKAESCYLPIDCSISLEHCKGSL